MTYAFHDPQFSTDSELHKVVIKQLADRYVIIIDDRHLFIADPY